MQRNVEVPLRTVQIVWGALFCGPILTMAVMHVVRPSMEDSGEGLLPLVIASYVLAVMAPLLGVLLQGSTLRNLRQQQPSPTPTNLFMTVTVLRSALGEGAALLSAIAYMLTGNRLTYGAFALALATMLWVRPTEERYGTFQSELGPLA